MDVWDLDSLTESDIDGVSCAELAGFELAAQAMFSVNEARLRVLHTSVDDD